MEGYHAMVEEGLMIFNCLSDYPWAVWVQYLMVFDFGWVLHGERR
jgi:hypothetical protein